MVIEGKFWVKIYRIWKQICQGVVVLFLIIKQIFNRILDTFCQVECVAEKEGLVVLQIEHHFNVGLIRLGYLKRVFCVS